MGKNHSDCERGNPLPPHGYSFRLAARVLLYASSHRQDNTYHSLCYTSRGALAGTRNSSMGPPHEGSIRRPIAPWANARNVRKWDTSLQLVTDCSQFHFPWGWRVADNDWYQHIKNRAYFTHSWLCVLLHAARSEFVSTHREVSP